MGVFGDAFMSLQGRSVAQIPKSIGGKRAAKYREEWHFIPDLKPGDKVQWKGEEYAIYKIPEVGQEVEVFRVLDKHIIDAGSDTSYEAEEKDFTILFETANGNIIESAYSSRRFERV